MRVPLLAPLTRHCPHPPPLDIRGAVSKEESRGRCQPEGGWREAQLWGLKLCHPPVTEQRERQTGILPWAQWSIPPFLSTTV
ncbi:hypothetical protein AAFF_G00150610 [Aldrovandia affinis]|uniref:Uncharacterized protein n=1 Tax=Aldrovandia affinis TaxID=143900 RepID=A0AAD7RPB6_9TELE|nr:hypothetical protein AAFF_G00150610 [Aldrovandia affinis]